MDLICRSRSARTNSADRRRHHQHKRVLEQHAPPVFMPGSRSASVSTGQLGSWHFDRVSGRGPRLLSGFFFFRSLFSRSDRWLSGVCRDIGGRPSFFSVLLSSSPSFACPPPAANICIGGRRRTPADLRVLVVELLRHDRQVAAPPVAIAPDFIFGCRSRAGVVVRAAAPHRPANPASITPAGAERLRGRASHMSPRTVDSGILQHLRSDFIGCASRRRRPLRLERPAPNSCRTAAGRPASPAFRHRVCIRESSVGLG